MGIRCRRLIVLGQRRSPRAPVAVAALHRPEPDSDPTPLEPLSARRRRCSRCSRRLAVSAGTLCRCGQLLCNEHRHAEAHDCTFDYKALAYRGDTPGPSSASCQRSDWVDVRAGIDDDAIVLAARALQPRGPDGSATLKFQMTSGEPGLMCFHRLAIINRNENGMQPFRTDGARFMCTGEIYNHTQLQMDEGISEEMRSDVEVVMRMLTRDGSDEGAGVTCRRLDGDFAFVYTRGDRVIAGRDPVGVRPLFYGVKEGRVVAFASEAKALTAAGCLDDVHAFPPGCFWSSDLEGFVQYTDVYDAAPAARTAEMAMHAWIGADKSSARPYQAAVRRLLTESVRKRVDHSDRPIAFLCSGGLDSSIVVALAAEMYPHRELHAFSVEFEGAASQDAVYATELLKLLPRVEHTRVTLTEEQALTYMRDVVQVCETADVRTLRAAVPMFHLAKYISERTEYKVVLSGEGADEAFMGYFYFRMATSPEAACDEAKRLVRGLYAFDLLRADRCFAAHGLEVRVPFLDRDLLRCVFAMPAGVRHDADGGSIVEKALLREAFSDVEALERTGIIHRGKMCLSDGVGYTMVERLVHSFAPTCPRAEDKLQAEQSAVDEWFREAFGRSQPRWAVRRVMPEWADSARIPDVAAAPPVGGSHAAAAVWW